MPKPLSPVSSTRNLMRERELQTLDLEDITARARHWGERIGAEARGS